MAKVAIDIRLIGKQRTGDETVFFELTRSLIHKHPEHQYILLTDQPESELPALRKRLQLEKAASETELIAFGPQNRFWWNAITLPLFFLKRKDIQVFHTQYILPFYIPRRIQVVAHIHDISFARFPEFIGKKDLFFLNVFIPRTLKRATIIVPSEFTKQEILEVYTVPESKVAVVPNAPGSGFVSCLQNEPSESKKRVQEKYHLPERYLLYVGTLQPRKNIPYLLAVFAEYQKQVPAARLVIVGNRKAHHVDAGINETVERLQLQQQVVFPGYVENEDLPFVYKGAQAFVFPSRYEGFAIPLLEALAAGVPTYASDIPVHREVGGAKVVYFPLDDVAAAAKILYTIPITESGHLDTRQYSWDTSACLLADWYQKISQ